MMHLLLLVMLALASPALATAPEASTSQLRQVIVLSRHGIRGPYGLGTEIPSVELLKHYVRNPNVELPLSAVAWGTSETDDPVEIVSPKITKHGYRVVELMGEYFRRHLYADFLDDSCEKTFAYADANQRDNLTARAFLSGMYPTCKDLVPITNATRLLFEQGADPTADCPVCSKTVYEGITGANDSRYLVQEIHKEIAELNSILECCAASVCDPTISDYENDDADDDSPSSSSSDCDFFGVSSQWNGAFYLPWRDTLSDADYFSEWLLLQSLNNMSLPEGLTFRKVLSLAQIHETHMDLITNEVNSANFGATLLAHITASFEQNIQGKPLPLPSGDGPQLLQSPDNRFLYYAAHDINLLYVRNLLRLQWYTKGWHPHQPVPGGMLIFELHSTVDDSIASVKKTQQRGLNGADSSSAFDTDEQALSDDDFFVKLYFVSASPHQMRHAEALSPSNPPDRVPVIIPTCSEDVTLWNGEIDVRCPYATFKKLMGKTLKHICVAETLRPFVDSLLSTASTTTDVSTTAADDGNDENDDDVKIVSPIIVLGVIATCIALVGLAVAVRQILRHHWARRASVQQPEYGAVSQQSTPAL